MIEKYKSILHGQKSKSIYEFLISEFPDGTFTLFKLIEQLTLNQKYSDMLFEHYFKKAYSTSYPYEVFSKKVSFDKIVEVIEKNKNNQRYKLLIYHFLPYMNHKMKSTGEQNIVTSYTTMIDNIK